MVLIKLFLGYCSNMIIHIGATWDDHAFLYKSIKNVLIYCRLQLEFVLKQTRDVWVSKGKSKLHHMSVQGRNQLFICRISRPTYSLIATFRWFSF